MSDFAKISELVTQGQQLLDSIKGGAIRTMQTQFDALKQQFTDKLSSVNTELAQFVSQQKTNVSSIFNEPDNRYQVLHTQSHDVVVTGTRNMWYPVVIAIPNAMTSLSISRYTHTDSDTFGLWNGALALDMRVCGRNAGGINSAALVERYQVAKKSLSRILPDADIPFVGRISHQVGPNHVVVWLRGETTYKLACDWGRVTFTVHDDGIPFNVYSGYPEIDARPVSDGTDISVPSIGYIRGE